MTPPPFWNFSENSSVLEGKGVPYHVQSITLCLTMYIVDCAHVFAWLVYHDTPCFIQVYHIVSHKPPQCATVANISWYIVCHSGSPQLVYSDGWVMRIAQERGNDGPQGAKTTKQKIWAKKRNKGGFLPSAWWHIVRWHTDGCFWRIG